jgi:hypothetical protein
MSYRFARFWARALVAIGVMLAATGVLFAALALTLEMPWGGITGQAVVERTVAAAVLIVSGVLAGGPFIVLGEMMRVALDQRRLVARIARRLRRWDARIVRDGGGPPRA